MRPFVRNRYARIVQTSSTTHKKSMEDSKSDSDFQEGEAKVLVLGSGKLRLIGQLEPQTVHGKPQNSITVGKATNANRISDNSFYRTLRS